MTTIRVKLFGTPVIYKNNEQITFPYRKAEALFYYLLINEQVTREVLVDLLWSSIGESAAKKNLRNAVYIIKKAFKEEILLSPQRTIIKLNPDIEFKVDVFEFLRGKNDILLESYKAEFLEGFFVKDAENFEQWMLEQRNSYREMVIERLYKIIDKHMEEGKLTEAEKFCKEIIKIDEFDEDAYRILLNIYRQEGKYNKCIEEYNKLVNLLNEELSLQPDIRTTSLFEEIIKERSSKEILNKNKNNEFFYGRKRELNILKNNYQSFLGNHSAHSIVVTGEAGIGKSKLVEQFLSFVDKSRINIFATNCYQAEEKFLLKPWYEIIKQLSDVIKEENIKIPKVLKKIIGSVFPTFIMEEKLTNINPIEKVDFLKYQVAERAIFDMFDIVNKNKKMIFVFEDIQWIDEMSLDLLKNIMLQNKNESIIFIATCRIGYSKSIENFLVEMGMYDLLKNIFIDRFNKKETMELASKLVSGYNLMPEMKELIYRETEGNPLFIVEYLNNIKENPKLQKMSQRMKDIIKSRFMNVSDEGKKILNIASVFFDKVDYEELLELSGKNEFELLDILEELQDKYLLKEVNGFNNISYVFTHQKLREYIYSQLTFSKRKILHNKIGSLIEKKLTNDYRDRLLYSKLIYHFENAGNKLAALDYRIKNIYEYLHFIHEIFPIIDDKEAYKVKKNYLSNKQVLKELDKIEKLFTEINFQNDRERFIKLEISFLHMIGRYFIIRGIYDKGLNKINNMIKKSLEHNYYEYALKGYLQLIYYCINVHDIENMKYNIRKGIQIVKKLGQKGEIAVLLRLKGLQKIMEGNFESGERLIKDALKIFLAIENRDKHILNIAASYYYLGESNRFKMEFEKAIYYYEKAISICEENGLVDRLTIFYTNAGQAAYNMEDFETAEGYLQKALNLYKQLEFQWGQAIAYAFMSLLLVKRGNYKEAFKHLKRAEELVYVLKNPCEMGLVYRVKAEICSIMNKKDEVDNDLYCYFTENKEKYCEKAIEYFRNIKICCFENNLIEKIHSWCNTCENRN